MRKILKYTILCLIIAGLGFLICLQNRRIDRTKPQLQADSDTIKISAKAGEESLLEGMHAYDKEDGDLTDRILIENISEFHTDKSRTVSYVVVDASGNVSRLKRTLQYTDYQSPTFELISDPAYTTYEDEFDTVGGIKAHDVIDGDISKQIRLVASSSTYGDSKSYTYAVTNSAGDSTQIKIDILKDTISKSQYDASPKITLKTYLIYADKDDIDYLSYVDEIQGAAIPYQDGKPSGYNKNYYHYDEEAGVLREKLTKKDIDLIITPTDADNYYVDFILTSLEGNTDTARLMVIKHRQEGVSYEENE